MIDPLLFPFRLPAQVRLALMRHDLTRALSHLVNQPDAFALGWLGAHRAGLDLDLFAQPLSIVRPGSRAFEPPIRDPLLASHLLVVRLGESGSFNDIPTIPLTGDRQYASVWLSIDNTKQAIHLLGGCESDDGSQVPLADIRIVGAKMSTFHPSSRLGRQPPQSESPQDGRWSRPRRAIGNRSWERIARSRIVIVGCGRTGSIVAAQLARFGVRQLTLIDPDLIQSWNLDMDGVLAGDLGQLKVEALAGYLRATAPGIQLQSCARSITSLEALDHVRACDVVISTVDDDGARWAVNAFASLYLKPVIDVGSGIFRDAGQTHVGADVRLVLPGTGCLACLGGMGNQEQVRAMQTSGLEEVRFRGARIWHQERAGSLSSLNAIAVGLGLRLLEDLFIGRISATTWLRLEYVDGIPRIERVATAAIDCPICQTRGLGDGGLARIRAFGEG